MDARVGRLRLHHDVGQVAAYSALFRAKTCSQAEPRLVMAALTVCRLRLHLDGAACSALLSRV